jgi:hypothetical protein
MNFRFINRPSLHERYEYPKFGGGVRRAAFAYFSWCYRSSELESDRARRVSNGDSISARVRVPLRETIRSNRSKVRPGPQPESLMMHFPCRHVHVKQARVQAAELLTKGDQFLLAAFMFPPQNLPEQRGRT